MITLLRLNDFRNFPNTEITFNSQGLNVIYGDNGSGKTSLLEAIHFLSLGSSFRTSTSQPLVRNNAKKFSIFAQLNALEGRMIPLGVEKESHGSSRMRMDERNIASLTEVASYLPIRVINAHSHHLFESGPVFRRKYLDWGLFYGVAEFLPCWRHYSRVLKQRNTVLKEKRNKRELDAWTAEVLKYGLELDKLRRAYVQDLHPFIDEAANELLALNNLQIDYLPGWDEGLGYSEELAENYLEEYRAGYTLVGPHRADLDLSIEGIPVKPFLSRGQQKLLVCAMMVAQGRLLGKQANKSVIYLIDDLPSELDGQSRQKLMSLLTKQPNQIFITVIEKEMVNEFFSDKWSTSPKLFHVEHNDVVENA